MAPHRHGKNRKQNRGRPYHKSRSRKKKKKGKIEAGANALVQQHLTRRHKAASQAVSSSSESEDEVNPYRQLVTSLPKPPKQNQEESDEYLDTDEEEEKQDEEIDVDTNDSSDGAEDAGSGNEDLNKPEDHQAKSVGDSDAGKEIKDDVEDLPEDDELMDENVNAEEYALKESDPFYIHFETMQDESLIENHISSPKWNKSAIKIPHIGQSTVQSMGNKTVTNMASCEKDLRKLYVKQKLCDEILDTNKTLCNTEPSSSEGLLTNFQNSLFNIFNNYQDVYYPERTIENGEQIRLVYCLHAINHILKTRNRVIAHNTKLKNKPEGVEPEEYRDQGLTRPKVLIVVPFRDSALRIVNMMIGLLLPKNQKSVSVKQRLQEEYGEEEGGTVKGNMKKPDDFEAIFAGNVDDHFRIGLSVAKNTLKLYTKFYMSDIILASPLGLRTIIGSEGDKERDFDFLNSIELLIFDQADIFLMQNWDHVLHLMDHLHLQPKESHGVDFSRVRMWTLNGWSKFYRQTLMFSSITHPQMNSLFNKHCHNFAGKLTICRSFTSGSIRQIVAQIPQVFHKISSPSYSAAADARFEFFLKKVLPHHKNSVMSQTMIYIPSYFDFVRVRNYFVREEVDFVHVNEYSEDKSISRSRNMFYHGKTHFLLYTERCHFFKRYRMRGIRHLVFYELPQYPHYYSELCNMFQDRRSNTDGDNRTCTAMYTVYDAQRLAEVVGTDRAGHMINSDKSVHMFVTGEDT